MSDPALAGFAFLPWLRRGLATQIARNDGGGSAEPRATVQVALSLNSAPLPAVKLTLAGPGDVTGFNAAAVIRTWPRPDVHDAEPNFFPMVEFDQPDLPWRYTPAHPTGQDRLRPWICLIAVTDDEIDTFSATGPDRHLAAVKLKDGAALPDLGQAWAWAHTQVTGVSKLDATASADLLAKDPTRFVSRVLCARRLDPATYYTVFLVPTFERGRLGGLQQTVADSVDDLTPAWAPQQAGGVELPAYYQWRFQTGTAGDFKSLVQQLKTRRLPDTVGLRDLDVSHPGGGLPGASPSPLGLEGALEAPTTVSTAWADADRTKFVTALAALVNRPADAMSSPHFEQILAPPLYGASHAARIRLEPGSPPHWFQELNADPRLRVSAGLGTMVVQGQQQQLMASAWRQVDGVRQINEQLRHAQLALELAKRVYDQHIMAAAPETMLRITAPVHGRAHASPMTIRQRIANSPIGSGVLQPQFRRIARPRGPLARGLQSGQAPTSAALLERLNHAELSIAPTPSTPSGMATPTRTGASLGSGLKGLAGLGSFSNLLAQVFPLVVLLLIAAVLLLAVGAPTILIVVLVAIAAIGALIVPAATTAAQAVRISDALQQGQFTPDLVAGLPLTPDFVAAETPSGSDNPVAPPSPVKVQAGDSPSASDFRVAVTALLAGLSIPPTQPPPLLPVDLVALRQKLATALDPKTTVVASYRQRLQLSSNPAWQSNDPLDQVMAAPKFDQPMYAPLRDLSQDWLFPGLERVPANTISLLMSNQRFIEAYMVGLSQAMGRALLWNGYPTDRRGTYFRQFWDASTHVPAPGQTTDPESLKDIKPIHTWPKQSAIGDNGSRPPVPGGDRLVLLIRGELLHRYPNAIIYATRAKETPDGKLEPGDDETHPVFNGTLKPDVAFFGFEITSTEARGDPKTNDPGWFFVLQEHPSEPRFGLDPANGSGAPLANWDDFSWNSLAATSADLAKLKYIDLNADLPDTRQVSDPGGPGAAWHADKGTGAGGARASDLAYITLRRPVRVAVHAADMLPAPAGG